VLPMIVYTGKQARPQLQVQHDHSSIAALAAAYCTMTRVEGIVSFRFRRSQSRVMRYHYIVTLSAT
jgi:hypothetical protein